MFEVGEKVMYSVNGVCEITDITEKVFGKTKIKYYVLKPVYNDKSTLFVPVENENLVSKMKKLWSSDKLDKVLDEISHKEVSWNSNDVARKEEFRNTISYGNVEDILVLLKLIWQQRCAQISKGRRLHISDEMYLRDAERMIKEEIATVIGISQDEVIPYIQDKILV